MISISSTVILMVIVPPLVHFLRPYYRREAVRSLVAEEDMVNGDEVESETSDRLHVHLAVVACVIAAVSLLGAVASTTTRTLILCKRSIVILFVDRLTSVIQRERSLDLLLFMVLRSVAWSPDLLIH